MSACARLLLGYRVSWRSILAECRAADPEGAWYSDALRIIRLSGACRAPGMQPVGSEEWHIPAAERARLERDDARREAVAQSAPTDDE